MTGPIDGFMTNILKKKGGMSLTTGFDVDFKFRNSTGNFITKFYNEDSSENQRNIVNMLCDEAQLPNVQSSVGAVTGRYLGEGSISYPTTRIFTDVSLGFLCDAELTPLKFFTSWYEFIYGEGFASFADMTYGGTYEDALSLTPRATNRTNRLQYMDDYVADVKIQKTEPDKKSYRGRSPITYILENAYPYAIDAVPLAYGSSQLTRVNINLYYTRHTIQYGDQTWNSREVPVGGP